MSTMWKEVMKEVREKRKWMYNPPFSKNKSIRVNRPRKHGKVKVYTEEEIYLYKIRQLKTSFDY